MKIVRDNIINEEVVGLIKSFDKRKVFKVLKNPSTVSKLNADIRGISYYGDFYLVNSTNTGMMLHQDIVDWLLNEGIIPGVAQDYWAGWGYDNGLIAWKRSAKSNKFFLSESYMNGNEGNYSHHLDTIKNDYGKDLGDNVSIDYHTMGDYYFMFEKREGGDW